MISNNKRHFLTSYNEFVTVLYSPIKFKRNKFEDLITAQPKGYWFL